MSLYKRDAIAGYLFVAPILTLMMIWFYFPAVTSLVYSFQNINFLAMDKATFVGLDNFQKLFADKSFIQATKNTFVITLVSVPCLIVFGFLIAYFIESLSRGKSFYRTLFYIPSVISAVALTMSLMYLFIEKGFIPSLLNRIIGTPDVTWPADTRTSLVFVCILVIWKNLGFFAIMYVTGLQGIPSEINEAASVDGTNGFQRMLYITLPQLRPTTALVITVSTIWCMQCFDEPYTLARSGSIVGSPAGTTSTMVTFFYSQNFRFFQPGYASSAAFVIFMILMVVSIAQRVIQNRVSEA